MDDLVTLIASDGGCACLDWICALELLRYPILLFTFLAGVLAILIIHPRDFFGHPDPRLSKHVIKTKSASTADEWIADITALAWYENEKYLRRSSVNLKRALWLLGIALALLMVQTLAT